MKKSEMTTRQKDRLREKMKRIERARNKTPNCGMLTYGQQGKLFTSPPSRHEPTFNINHAGTFPEMVKVGKFLCIRFRSGCVQIIYNRSVRNVTFSPDRKQAKLDCGLILK